VRLVRPAGPFRDQWTRRRQRRRAIMAGVRSVRVVLDPLPKLGEINRIGSTLSTALKIKGSPKTVKLHWATATGPWQRRDWKSVDARWDDGELSLICLKFGLWCIIYPWLTIADWKSARDTRLLHAIKPRYRLARVRCHSTCRDKPSSSDTWGVQPV
jgi:hypothetical protein